MMNKSTGKSIYELHVDWVERLKERGEKIVLPHAEPFGRIKGYDKTKGLKSAGSIYRNKDGEFELLQDMNIRGDVVSWTDIGLCDAKCWYEALDEDREHELEKAKKMHEAQDYTNELEKAEKRKETDEQLTQLLVHGIKELGEIAEVVIKKNKPDHWVNELGDLCGLVIVPMLDLAGIDFNCAVELGLSRKRKKMQETSMEEKSTVSSAPAQVMKDRNARS